MVSKAECTAHGWPHKAFSRCVCTAQPCMRRLAAIAPDRLDMLAKRVFDAKTASEADAKAQMPIEGPHGGLGRCAAQRRPAW